MKHNKEGVKKCWDNVTEEVSAVLSLEKYIIIHEAEGTQEQTHQEMKHSGTAQSNGSHGYDLSGGGGIAKCQK